MENNRKKKRAVWIDLAKAVAIVAVLIDHTNLILYADDKIAYMTYFSVSLFILMMGITSYWSINKGKQSIGSFIAGKCWGIFRPYLVATFIYQLFLWAHWDFLTYLKGIIHFDMSPPFYYVFLYMQLVVAVPVIYILLVYFDKKKYALLWETGLLLLIVIISILTTKYTNILYILGGGGKLFGGTYLILLYLGMWFAKYYNRISLKLKSSVIVFVTGFIATTGWSLFVSENRCKLDRIFPFGEGLNPPGVSLGLHAVLIAVTIFAFEQMVNNINNEKLFKVYEKAAFLGKHTLYIYLYHRLFLDFIFPILRRTTGVVIDNMWIKRVVYLPVIIILPICMEKLFTEIYKIFSSGSKFHKKTA